MRNAPPPPLTALRAFEAAARHLSFRNAADELGITHSAVSHRIAALEKFLKTRLFRRLARRVELTEAGVLYYPYLRDAFERIALGTALVSRATVSGELTVQVYVTVAVRWLIPRLHDFQTRHPDIAVRLNASQLDWEFDAEAGDIGMICTQSVNRPGLHCSHLFDAKLSPVCRPDIARNLKRPSDLANQALLQLYTASEDWQAWLTAAGVAGLHGRAAPKFDSYLLALEAANDGQGVAIAPHFLVAADLKSGRLIKPFTLAVQQPRRWCLVCRKERRNEPRIQRFRDWLTEQIAADPNI